MSDYPYRRTCDRYLDVAVIVFLVGLGIGFWCWMASKEPSTQPEKPQVYIKDPDAEKFGHIAGNSAAGVGKGFYTGFKERLHNKNELIVKPHKNKDGFYVVQFKPDGKVLETIKNIKLRETSDVISLKLVATNIDENLPICGYIFIFNPEEKYPVSPKDSGYVSYFHPAKSNGISIKEDVIVEINPTILELSNKEWFKEEEINLIVIGLDEKENGKTYSVPFEKATLKLSNEK